MNWIKVSDRFPDDGQKVVFYVRNREVAFCGDFAKNEEILNVLKENVFRDSLDGWWFEDEEITHWMPLPDLPKDDE